MKESQAERVVLMHVRLAKPLGSGVVLNLNGSRYALPKTHVEALQRLLVAVLERP